MQEQSRTILVIQGSPRKNGVSAQMLAYFLREMQRRADEDAVRIKTYDAYASRFAPCVDCRFCCREERCALRDMDGFYRDFETADGIVFASPVYNYSFPAPVKVILDRMQRYYNARFSLGRKPPIAKHRPAALLMSAGSPDEDGEVMVRQLERIFTVTNCSLVCHALQNGTDSGIPSAQWEKPVRDCAEIFMQKVK